MFLLEDLAQPFPLIKLLHDYISSVSERLFGNIIVLFLSVINKLDRIWILSSGKRLLSLLICDEWLSFINIITLTISESEMVSLVSLVPHGWKQVRDDQIEKLGHVNDVQELCSVSDIKPHPVSVGLQTNWLKTQELQEVRTINSIKIMIITLYLPTNECLIDTCSRTLHHSSWCTRSMSTSFYYSYLLL